MKNLLFLSLILFNALAWGEQKPKLTAIEIDQRCQKLSKEKFEKFKAVCWKAQEELKKNTKPVSEKKTKMSDEDIVKKCESFSEEKKNKYKKVCTEATNRLKNKGDKILLKHPDDDPYFKALKNPKNSTWNVYLGYSGVLGSIRGFDLEIERQYKHFGFGAFFSQQTILGLDNTGWLKGNAYGVSVKYHFYPVSHTNRFKIFNPAIYANAGMASYESEIQGSLPQYMYFNIGGEASFPLLKIGQSSQLSGFTKIGIGQIYHQESNFLHIGTGLTLGVKFEF